MTAGQPERVRGAWLWIAQPTTQLPSRPERIGYIGGLASSLARRKQGDANILILPELFLSGYGRTLADPDKTAEEDERRLQLVRGIARAERIWIVVGLARVRCHGITNSAVAINPQGREVADYDKIFLFGDEENEAFTRGLETVIFDSPLGRTALAVCYDVEHPQFMAWLRQAGASTVLVPTANMAPYRQVARHIVPELAAETGMRVVYANHAGVDGQLILLGESTVVDENGKIISLMGSEPGVGMVYMNHDRLPVMETVTRQSYPRLTG